MAWWGTAIGRIAAGLVLALLLAAAAWVYATGWAPGARAYAIQGVDVSEAQGGIVWTTLAARGADFAYLRATTGAHRRDARFAANWDAAAAAGLRRGAVHLWSFCADGTAQADNFVTTVPRTADSLPAVLELAFSPDCAARPDRAALVEHVKRFLTIAETHTGEPMLIKITRPVERAYQLSAAIPRPLWEVRNFLAPDYATRPWRMWQASDMRRVDGVSGPIDWDVVAP
ncbi:MAG TPA: GH25 family lysozyme [Sphingomonas sp.]|nr:GH25 family lysozyme [Sphingomonas sp.]